MKTAKILKWATLLIAVIAVIGCVVWFTRPSEPVPVAKIEPARIIDVRPMVKLCSVEIYEEVPVKAKIGTRHLVARETLTGTISFDLEKIEQQWEGDTLVVTLPPEIVEVYESTDPGAYKVIDRWNDKILAGSNFTAAEENEIKRQVVEAWRDSIYSRGYVRRARTEAVKNLEAMLRPFVPGKEVRIKDNSEK
ncbi:MAG: DUF4230 domain-containing protein [Muribaculaceae bacterium]|nr:DUF4230 domain-containing protein [Muribaculaceae bacterium]